MRRNCLSLILLLLLSCTAFSQSIGLKVNPGVTFLNYPYQASASFASGLYWDHPISRTFGFSTGLQWTRLRAVNEQSACFWADSTCPYRVTHRFDMLELPLDLTMLLGQSASERTKVMLVTGYSFGVLLHKDSKSFSPIGAYVNELTALHGLRSQFHFFKLGIELRHLITRNLASALGVQLKYVGIYDQRYGGFAGLNFYLKLGLATRPAPLLRGK